MDKEFNSKGNKEMKVEISEDQNTLIANGVEYEARTGGHVCDDCSFWHINSFAGCSIGGMAFSKCAPKNRADGKSIHWIKKEAEQGDKKATAIFSDNEKVLTIVGHSEHDGTYEAKENFGCDGCFFENRKYKDNCEFDTSLSNQKCTFFRRDKKSIIWIKKEAKQMTEAPAPAPHRHFDLIVQWAKDPTQHIWFWSHRQLWEKTKYADWNSDFYALGEKPTAPPMKKLKVKIELDRNEFEIEVPYDARHQEVDKAILDMATHYMIVTQEVI